MDFKIVFFINYLKIEILKFFSIIKYTILSEDAELFNILLKIIVIF